VSTLVPPLVVGLFDLHFRYGAPDPTRRSQNPLRHFWVTVIRYYFGFILPRSIHVSRLFLFNLDPIESPNNPEIQGLPVVQRILQFATNSHLVSFQVCTF